MRHSEGTPDTVGRGGQVITAAIVALLIIAVFIPVIVHFVNQESRWSVKQKRTTNAFHLAEAGVDRGIWKLTEADQNWEDAADGVDIDGYADDVEYDDIQGGLYKIDISSGPASNQVTITAKGRDTSTNEMRAVQAVYSKAAINAGLHVEGGLTYKPNLHVHWGPVVTYTSIDQSPGDYFPRKYSKGQIVGRDTTNNPPNNTDSLEYWAFDTTLTTPPSVDLDYYKTKAKASSVPTTSSSPSGRVEKNTGGNSLAVSSPTAGCGYFLASQNSNAGLRFEKNGGAGNHYRFYNSTSVIYIDNDTGGAITTDLQNGGCYLNLEAIILAGNNHNLDINAQEGTIASTIPVNANLEYQHGSAAATWTAGGGSSMDSVWSQPDRCCYTLSSVAVRGFMYVGGGIANAGSNTQVLGVLDVIGNVSVNTLYVYYDEEVASNIALIGGSPSRISWQEVKTTW
jgi:hypothetical protein